MAAQYQSTGSGSLLIYDGTIYHRRGSVLYAARLPDRMRTAVNVRAALGEAVDWETLGPEDDDEHGISRTAMIDEALILAP